jgi:hypothetical protein
VWIYILRDATDIADASRKFGLYTPRMKAYVGREGEGPKKENPKYIHIR